MKWGTFVDRMAEEFNQNQGIIHAIWFQGEF